MNQWFSESQFESYRSLGFEIADSVLSSASIEPEYSSRCDLEAMFHALIKQAKTAARTVQTESVVSERPEWGRRESVSCTGEKTG